MNTFDRIIGYEREKKELGRICDMLINEEKYKKLGVNIPNALLIHGDPGLGKTLMARTLAESSGRVVYSCPKTKPDGSFVDNIKETFEKASQNAPSIVFLDDMDKFAEDNKSSDSNKEEFVVIQACLEEVKGKNVFVIATANNIDNLPESLVRAGRFGRQIYVSFPTIKESIEITKHYLKNKSISADVSADLIANMMPGESCATLSEVVNEAGIYAGYEGESVICQRHIIEAILNVVHHSYFSDDISEEMLKTISCHEAGHAAAILANGMEVGFVSILGSNYGGVGGFCKRIDERKRTLSSMETLKEEIMINLAGKASEEILLGTVSFGAKNDLEDAIENLRLAVEKQLVFGFEYGYDFRRFDEKQARSRQDKVSDKIFSVLREWYDDTLNLIKQWRPVIEDLMTVLMKQKCLLRDDVNKIMSNNKNLISSITQNC